MLIQGFLRGRGLWGACHLSMGLHTALKAVRKCQVGIAEITRLVSLEETGYDGEVEGHAAFCVNVDGWGLLLRERRGVFWGCVGIDGGRDAEQLGRERRRGERVLVSYPCNVVLRHLHLRSPSWSRRSVSVSVPGNAKFRF